MKGKSLAELIVKVVVAALTAFLTALGTTSCMGHGFYLCSKNYLFCKFCYFRNPNIVSGSHL